MQAPWGEAERDDVMMVALGGSEGAAAAVFVAVALVAKPEHVPAACAGVGTNLGCDREALGAAAPAAVGPAVEPKVALLALLLGRVARERLSAVGLS